MTDVTAARIAWESFYVIVGSCAGALIGLQFVVVTLIAEKRQLTTATSLGAFGTPTVVHLTGALLISAMMSIPWPSSTPLLWVLGVSGLGGVVYSIVVVGRARRQTTYRPVWQDWVWYAALPCVCYLSLTATAVLLRTNTRLAFFVAGGAALGLLLIGIHNAWDTVTHILVSDERAAPRRQTVTEDVEA